MDIRGLPSHGTEEAQFFAGGAQRDQFDTRTMRAQPAHNPATAQLHKRIGTSNSASDDRLIKDFRRSLMVLRPITGGGDEGFGLAGNPAAAPVSDGHIALMAQTAKPGNATS